MNTIENRSLLEPRRLGIIALVVGVAVLLIALGLPQVTGGSDDDPAAGALDMERRQVLEPPRELANFTLTNQDGEQVSLTDLAGKPVLLFFGFTHCPDVCPTTMAEFRQIKRNLGEQGDNVQFVLVSVDGSRDTPDVLKEYVAKFDPEFIGLTGDEDYVRQIGADYFLFFGRSSVEGTTSAAGYLVDHTSYSYLIDAEGRLRYVYPFQAPHEMIIADIQVLVDAAALGDD